MVEGEGKAGKAGLMVEEKGAFWEECGRPECVRHSMMRGKHCKDCGLSSSSVADACQKCQPKRYSDMMVRRVAEKAICNTLVLVFFVVTTLTLSCFCFVLLTFLYLGLGGLWDETSARSVCSILSLIIFIIFIMTALCTGIVIDSNLLCVPGSGLTDDQVRKVAKMARWTTKNKERPFIRLDYC